MGRIKVETRNEKGHMEFVECLVEWNVLYSMCETLPSIIR
jgi:hypothetical protein